MRALGFHVLAGMSIFALLTSFELVMTPFWISWLAVALIVAVRSAGGRRAWPWTLVWFVGWLSFFALIVVVPLSWEGPCPDCGAIF